MKQICDRALFWWHCRPKILLDKDYIEGVFLWIFLNSSEQLFYGTAVNCCLWLLIVYNFVAPSVMFLTHFTPLISFDTPWKHHKTKGFQMFSGVYQKRSVTWNGLKTHNCCKNLSESILTFVLSWGLFFVVFDKKISCWQMQRDFMVKFYNR